MRQENGGGAPEGYRIFFLRLPIYTHPINWRNCGKSSQEKNSAVNLRKFHFKHVDQRVRAKGPWHV